MISIPILLLILFIFFSPVGGTLQIPKRQFVRRILSDKQLESVPVRTLLIDNYDSYTYNLWQLLSEVNVEEPSVVLNDKYKDWADLLNNIGDTFDNVVLSPGPGNPRNKEDFGVSLDAIRNCRVPLLGVCLGHQGIGHAFGGIISRAKEPMHGRISSVSHTGEGLFDGIPEKFDVVRYHSLVVDSPLPSVLQETAWSEDGVVMALQHRLRPIYGVQFHPESICTSFGRKLMLNFKRLSIDNKTNSSVYSSGRLNSFSSPSTKVETITVSKLEESDKMKSHRYVDVLAVDFRGYMDKLDNLFGHLYGSNNASIWLDSSSSFSTKVISNPCKGGVCVGNYSFMAALETEDCYSIECISHNQIIHRYGWHATDDPSPVTCINHRFNENIFEHISNKYSNEKNIETLYSSEELPKQLSEVLFGYLGYECRNTATHILTSLSSASNSFNFSSTKDSSFKDSSFVDNASHPMAMFLVPSQFIVIDHKLHRLCIVSKSDELIDDISSDYQSFHAKIRSRTKAESLSRSLRDRIIDFMKESNESAEALSQSNQSHVSQPRILHSEKTMTQYKEDILSSLESIRNGDTYEVCLTTRFKGSASLSQSFSIYKELRKKNCAPYSSYLRYNPLSLYHSLNPLKEAEGETILSLGLQWCREEGFAALCSSPERFLQSSSDGYIETKPIKGTSRRDLTNPTFDAVMASALESDEKSRAENLMIVDLVRNDFGRVCRVGSVCVPRLMSVETYASVHQLVSTVSGYLRPEANIADVLVATFPGGSMTGAPKIRTMDIIENLEKRGRGIYSGALGYLSLNGVSDMNIVIRTAYLAEGQMSVGSGGAIVILSDPQQEVDEVLLKAQAVANALGYTISFPLS